MIERARFRIYGRASGGRMDYTAWELRGPETFAREDRVLRLDDGDWRPVRDEARARELVGRALPGLKELLWATQMEALTDHNDVRAQEHERALRVAVAREGYWSSAAKELIDAPPTVAILLTEPKL